MPVQDGEVAGKAGAVGRQPMTRTSRARNRDAIAGSPQRSCRLRPGGQRSKPVRPSGVKRVSKQATRVWGSKTRVCWPAGARSRSIAASMEELATIPRPMVVPIRRSRSPPPSASLAHIGLSGCAKLSSRRDRLRVNRGRTGGVGPWWCKWPRRSAQGHHDRTFRRESRVVQES